MNGEILFRIYIIFLALSFLTGLIRYKRADGASRFIVILLGLTLISEIIAEEFTRRYQNNMPVYHFFNPVELMLVSLYYNTTITAFRKWNAGVFIGISGIVLSAANTIFLQPMTTLNSNFLLFEGFCIIGMSLLSYKSMFDDVEMNVVANPHFWFSSLFLFTSGITYTMWALYGIIGVKMVTILPFLNIALLLISTAAYIAFGLVFLLLINKRN